ncbi:hypothetical protein IC229_13730 [Spirosoma sp. BT702]|uniref:Uncharacterized protein n=2 Tax=Spirosoma profusum TaxID=2771354 RepID=A0A926Y3E0_9BACT|nr:hypothetical protein [Spirosoma profusum]
MGDGHNSKFDFIRAFARYDLSDYPVLHFERSVGMLFISDDLITHPKLCIDPSNYHLDYLLAEYGCLEFELLGHVFAIATSPIWKLTFDLYINKSLDLKRQYFNGYRIIKKFNDVDLTLYKCFDDKRDNRLFNQ